MSVRFGESHHGDGRTYRAIVHVRGKPVAGMPGLLSCDSVSGTTLTQRFIGPDSSGNWKVFNTLPDNPDSEGTLIGAASGATAALSNLALVAINASLTPGSGNAIDIGSSDKPYRSGYFQTSLVLKQTTASYTVSWANPAAGRALTIIDPLGNDAFLFAAASQAVTNKTISGAANTISNISLTSILNAGGAAGDMAFWNGTNWVRLAKDPGKYLKSDTAPSWDTPGVGTAAIIASTATVECGANDLTLHFADPAGAAAHLDFPDPGTTDSVVYAILAATLASKILKTSCYFGDATDPTKMAAVDLSGATGTKTAALVFIHSLDRTYTFPDASGTVCLLDGAQTLETKTLKSSCLVGDATDPTKALHWDLSGATTGTKTTFTLIHSADRVITFPNASDTLVGKATGDVFTNKSIDCLGTGNAITNVNAKELDPIAASIGTFGIPFVIVCVNAGAATNVIFNANCPYKLRIIDAWAVATTGCNGNWHIDDGTTAITAAIAYGADKALTRATSIDDAKHLLDVNATLRLISSDAGDTAIVYIKAIRVD